MTAAAPLAHFFSSARRPRCGPRRALFLCTRIRLAIDRICLAARTGRDGDEPCRRTGKSLSRFEVASSCQPALSAATPLPTLHCCGLIASDLQLTANDTELVVGALAISVGSIEGSPMAAFGVESRAEGLWRSLRGGEIDARVELHLRLRRSAEGGIALDKERDEPYGHVIEEIGAGQPGACKEPRARHFCSGADPRIAIPASGMVDAAQQGLTHERCRSQPSRSRKTPCIFGGIHTCTPSPAGQNCIRNTQPQHPPKLSHGQLSPCSIRSPPCRGETNAQSR